MQRVILHCDMNNFYASVECMLNPELKNKPVAVCGSVEERHGIVLAKNYAAKAFGVSTGEAIWQAKQKCQDLVIVEPHYEQYMKFSKLARGIYGRYTDQIEPYGMDECWLDVTGSGCMGTGFEIADEIRRTVKFELGLTISAGVSFNKIFAKLGSDMKKPDAITCIEADSFQEKIWCLPASDLLGVGRATEKVLSGYGIHTIGELAATSDDFLKCRLGKNGLAIKKYANGLDDSPVMRSDYVSPVKSIWEKPIATVKSKKYLTDFTGMKPVEQRNSDEAYLSDDVSFVIAHNKKANDTVEIFSLLSYTNVNVLPFTEDIPLEVIAFLDPTIEKLCFEQTEGKTFIHLKFKDEEEIILNNAADLEQYLSSGTIKGIITFSMVKEVLHSGGYLLVDEIENHFNKEIVTTLVRFFMDSRLNKNGGTLIFTTHYPELLDEYDRNDGICIVRNRNGITAENLSYILKRNDIKKSDAYQSGFLEGTTPAYEAYMRLKKSLAASIN